MNQKGVELLSSAGFKSGFLGLGGVTGDFVMNF